MVKLVESEAAFVLADTSLLFVLLHAKKVSAVIANKKLLILVVKKANVITALSLLKIYFVNFILCHQLFMNIIENAVYKMPALRCTVSFC